MAKTPVPLRDGETLGAYYRWSAPLYGALLECNVDKAALRSFFEKN